MKKNSGKKILLAVLAIVALLLVLINVFKPAFVPDSIVNFATDYSGVAVGVVLAVAGIMFLSASPVIGVALILIGAFMVYSAFAKPRVEIKKVD